MKSCLVVGVYSLLASSAFALPKPGDAEERVIRQDNRARHLIAALDTPIPLVEAGERPLTCLLDDLMKAVTPAEVDKDPDRKIDIFVDDQLFREALGGMFDLERHQVTIRTKLTNARLGTVLDLVCKQMRGVLFIRDNYLEIIPEQSARNELNLDLINSRPLPPLIHAEYTKVPLNKIVEQLTQRYRRTVVLAPQAEAKLTCPITATFRNVPFDFAIDTIAEMAELKVIYKANVLFLTTPAHSDKLYDEYLKRLHMDVEAEKLKEELNNPRGKNERDPPPV